VNRDFHTAYRALEQRMKALAETDGQVYLPNPEPLAPVQYVLICMEPSLAGWAKSEEEARSKVAAGFQNFLASTLEINILHFCARSYLCGPADRYYITDMSKGAMLGSEANRDRRARWDRWFPLLLDEIALCATPNAQFIAVGREVSNYLADNFAQPFTYAIHYSPEARGARKTFSSAHQAAFERFKDTVSIKDILAATEATFCRANLRVDLREQWLKKLARRHLTDSHRQLIFHYKTKFESMRTEPRLAVAT
jgi:hypothetical protein